jgi:two-component system cell cycle sensor histidine kinase/response regulator CckA
MELWGYKPQDMIGRSLFDQMLPEDKEHASAMFRAMSESPSSFRGMETSGWDNAGRLIVLETSGVPFFDSEGKLRGYRGISRDITEHMQADEALRQAKEYAESLIQTTDAMVVGLDADGTVTVFNPGAERISGYTLADVKGKNWFEVLVPKHRYPDVWEEFAHFAEGGSIPRIVENPILTKSGEERMISWRNNELRPSGEVAGTISFGVDITERKRMEEELAKSERHFRSLIEHAADAIYVVTRGEGRIIACNAQASKDTGYSRDELLGMSASDLEVSRAGNEIDALHRSLRPGVTGGVEAVHKRKDGSTFPVEIRFALMEEAEPQLILSIVRDVTERKRTEEMLRLTQLSVDQAGDFIQWLAPDGQVLYASESSCRRLGYSHEEILTKSVFDLNPTTAPESWPEHWRLMKERGSMTFESEHSTKEGEVFPVEISANYVESGGREYVFSFVRDITERKQAERALRESEEKFRSSFMTGLDAFYIATLEEGRIVEINEVFEDVFGYSREEAIGKTSLELGLYYDPADRVRMVSELEANGFVRDLELKARRKGGETFTLSISVTPLVLDGKPHMLGVIRDITDRIRAQEERHELERQLQQSQKLESLGVLAGGIAHDFNNILTSVLGNAELALAELPASASARENLLAITRASHRAAALCRQMLAYSGRGHLVTEAVNLNALIEDMLDLLKSSISKKAVLDLHLKKDLPLLEGDPSQLGQVIMNLVMNASEAIGDEDGVITIATGARECSREYLRRSYAQQGLPPGLYLTLEVSDTGCGMDQETQAHLFEPFFTTKFAGRGLGLSAVLGIVRGHRGAVRVYSEPGKGTTFKIRFPAAEAGTEVPLGKASPSPMTGKEWAPSFWWTTKRPSAL